MADPKETAKETATRKQDEKDDAAHAKAEAAREKTVTITAADRDEAEDIMYTITKESSKERFMSLLHTRPEQQEWIELIAHALADRGAPRHKDPDEVPGNAMDRARHQVVTNADYKKLEAEHIHLQDREATATARVAELQRELKNTQDLLQRETRIREQAEAAKAGAEEEARKKAEREGTSERPGIRRP